MNKLERFILKRKLKRLLNDKNLGGIMKILVDILAYIVKNVGLLVGILESIVKVITGIISLTPTKKDDNWLPIVDKIFSNIKKQLYNVSEMLHK